MDRPRALSSSVRSMFIASSLTEDVSRVKMVAVTTPHRPPLPRRLLAELLGTGLLVAVVVGSGIAAQQLSPDDVGLQLLENSTATVLGLTVLILLFGPVSGAHFNPVVSLADWFLGRRTGHGPDPAGRGRVHRRAGRRRGRRVRAGQRHVRRRHVGLDQGPGHRWAPARRGRRHHLPASR